MTGGNEAHKLRLQAILTAYGEGNFEPLREALDPDIVYHSHAPRELFRWGGIHVGVVNGIAALSALATDYAVHRYEVVDMVGEGDSVWVTAEMEATDRHKKVRLDARVATRWYFKADRIARVEEFYDSAGVALKQGLVTLGN